ATAAAKPGTSYAAPPLAGPLPATPAAAPAPKRIRVEPAATPDAAPKPAPVRAATAGPWRAQLGAFAVDGNAKKLWAALARKYPAVAAQTPVYVKAGSVTRLHATGFTTRADAQGFCATLQKSGQACLVVDK
ncbi:SPOR domain-containing protein, partial [Sphingopyxis sp. MC1]|uniref:SPOR domain-containing protein n=1 Tax=Sphingopyxis sp. MC1 TaxID=1174684 RepID=UPI0002D1B1EB